MTAVPRMFRRAALNRRRVWRQSKRVVGIVFLGLLLAVRFWDPTPVEVLRLKTLDLYQQIKPRTATAQPVVIVDIDEKSPVAHGQWPWARTLMADLVAKLFAAVASGLVHHIAASQGVVGEHAGSYINDLKKNLAGITSVAQLNQITSGTFTYGSPTINLAANSNYKFNYSINFAAKSQRDRLI